MFKKKKKTNKKTDGDFSPKFPFENCYLENLFTENKSKKQISIMQRKQIKKESDNPGLQSSTFQVFKQQNH